MAQHNELGIEGEKEAILFLEKKGYFIKEKNWRFQKTEIDIIASNDNFLVFVEVKTRSSTDFGLPQDFVKTKKVQNIVKAAHEYIMTHDNELKIRFDIVAITKTGKKFEIEHIEDAFFYF